MVGIKRHGSRFYTIQFFQNGKQVKCHVDRLKVYKYGAGENNDCKNQTDKSIEEQTGSEGAGTEEETVAPAPPELANDDAHASPRHYSYVSSSTPAEGITVMGDGWDAPGAAAARGLDLERAYVHDVYEHAEHERNEAPCQRAPAEREEKIVSFLTDLEPGSLVCDVGCGSGKYLQVKPSVFTLGADRCLPLAMQASDAGNEVIVCDNLSLPYRDDCFDAVVSAAVVHHFATTERRARALRELARVLRIGGRVLVTVWAMEQKGRRFESQDVLIPWHRPQTLCAPSPGLPRRDETPDERRRRERFAKSKETKYRQFLSTHSDGETHRDCDLKCRQRGCSMDASRAALYSPGHSSLSSLSSPNETCYSFVRRAIQKLAGGKGTTRPWFLESWSAYSKQEQTRYDPDGSEDLLESDIRNLPIELRRIDDEEEPLRRQTFNCPDLSSELYVAHKSKSLSDILSVQDKSLIRSRSSIPSLGGSFGESEIPEPIVEENKNDSVERKSKPKLVKQKKSVNEEDAEEDLDKPTDMKSLVEELPTFKVSTHRPIRKPGMFKQSSLNEEFMSTDRLREKERLRKNMKKQASLNEEYLYRRNATLDSLRDSFFSTSANTAKKFQLLKNGLTNKFKTSTTNMEKVTVIGFVKMFQGWKSQDMPTTSDNGPTTPQSESKYSDREDIILTERRHSKEDGSDSSKDSSLQSDTSVDSEDSFASVIYVPKTDSSSQDPLSPAPLSPGPTSPRLKVSSVPTSPRIKTSPGLPSPRLKQVFPILRPPLSPKSTQAPLQLNKILVAQYSLKNNSTTNAIKEGNDPSLFSIKTKSSPTSPPNLSEEVTKIPLTRPDSKMNFSGIEGMGILNTVVEESDITSQQLIDEINKDIEEIHKLTAETNNVTPRILQDSKPYPKITLQTVAELPEIPQFRGKREGNHTDTLDSRGMDRKKKERLRQVRDLLKQGFGTKNPKMMFPIVRRQLGKTESIARTHPTLLSLEVFNPETDDPDSDSSEPSSPDSVESVISVVPDDTRRTSSEKENTMSTIKYDSDTTKTLLNPIAAEVKVSLPLEVMTNDTQSQSQTSPRSNPIKLSDTIDGQGSLQEASSSSSGSNWSLNRLSPGDLRLLEERSRSHTSSSGSTSSLERLSPGRRSKERSPKRSSNGNSTWSLNRLSPSKRDRSFEENGPKRSPTRFAYDSMTTSSTESDKSISKSESFTRLQAEEKLVTCKSDIVSQDDEIEWKNDSQQQLTEFAEKLSEKLLHEIDQYSKRINEEDFDILSSSSNEASALLKLRREREDEQTQKVLDDLSGSLQHLDDTYVNKQGLSKLSADIHERNKYIASLKATDSEELIDLFPKCSSKLKSEKETVKNKSGKAKIAEDGLVKKTIRITDKQNNNNNHPINMHNIMSINEDEKSDIDYTNTRTPTAIICPHNGNPEITVDSDNKSELSQSLETGYSIESEISVDSFCTDKRSSLRVGHSTDSSEVEKMEISPESLTSRSSATGSNTSGSAAPLRSGFSIESSDAGDTSMSGSDWSRRDPSLGTAKTGSLASLGASVASLPACYEVAWSAPVRPPARLLADGRSSSEESKTRAPLAPTPRHLLEPSLSDTSQDSLPSEGAGGAVTFHRYYHVFREGELDQLIEKYVENLHIISSFYDHSSWCVVAEKVQVWTI